jgi:hypothetical protein
MEALATASISGLRACGAHLVISARDREQKATAVEGLVALNAPNLITW